jgi:hypothetical protein
VDKGNNQCHVEGNRKGSYTAAKGGAGRASAIGDTQAKAIERAREIDPAAPIHIERVRHTAQGFPDRWRKP